VETIQKLQRLSQDMNLEPDGVKEADCRPVVGNREHDFIPISEVSMPGGKKMKVLKTLLTSACERNCYYCPFRAGRNSLRRTTFKPDELASIFMQMHQAKLAEGIFLSSGIIKGGVATQDRLIETAEILRNKYNYRGYLHLKMMPGVEKGQVLRSMQLASRVSTNLEAPNDKRLASLAPMKQFTEELLQPLKWVEEIRQNQPPHTAWNGRWPSTVSQFVVGAAGESDLELLSTSEYLYQQTKLKRVYYSAFRPIPDTPLDGHSPEDPVREHRLYQSSFLLRDYGYSLEEMPFTQAGNLPKDVDPKLAWAQANLHEPLEINRAGREQLLRIPGIGPKAATAILLARRTGKLRSINDLRRLGISPKRPLPFILLDGRRPSHQPALF
jgi:predicted DNA-binding helix-hairpin-helix protein